MYNLAQESQAFISLRGQGRVTLIEHMTKHMTGIESLSQLQGMIQSELGVAYSIVSDEQYNWSSLTRRDTLPPGVSPTAYKDLRDLVLMNTESGQVPEGASPQVTAIGRKGAEATRPLSSSEIRGLEDFIARPPPGTDPNDIEEARRAIGGYPHLGNRVRGVD